MQTTRLMIFVIRTCFLATRTSETNERLGLLLVSALQ